MSIIGHAKAALDAGAGTLAERVRTTLDCWRFRRARAEYYEYLAALLAGMQGSRTLRTIFQRDAARYGNGSARGRLAQQWADSFPRSGGDLYATWLSCFPLGELGIIRAAQLAGNAPLIATLHDLAGLLALTRQARRILGGALWSAVAALVIFLTVLLAVPLFSVPQLLRAFGMVPPEFYGGLTQSLLGFSLAIRSHGLLFAIGLLALAGWVVWSLPNFVGPLRRRLDRYSLWKIHRCVGGLQLIAALTVVLARSQVAFTQLRAALIMQRAGGSNWQRWQIETMLTRIDAGLVGADTFDTGLLDQETFWFLDDMTQAHGLVRALMLTRQRIEQTVLVDVARQATVLRWGLLMFCVAGVLSLGVWHYAVIDELRRSLMLFYASQ